MSTKKKPAQVRFTPVLVGYRTLSGVAMYDVKPGHFSIDANAGQHPDKRDDLEWTGHIPGAGVEEWRDEIQRIEAHDILPPLEPDLKRMKAGLRVRALAQKWDEAWRELEAAREAQKSAGTATAKKEAAAKVDQAWTKERAMEQAHHNERTEAQSLALDYVMALQRIEKMLRVVATSPDTEELTRGDIVRNLREFYERIWTAKEAKTAGKYADADRRLYIELMKLPEWTEAGEKRGKRSRKKTKDAHPEIEKWTRWEMVRVVKAAAAYRREKRVTDDEGLIITARSGATGPDMKRFRDFTSFWNGYLRSQLAARWEAHRNEMAKKEATDRDLADQERRRQTVATAARQGVPFVDHGPVPLSKLQEPFDRAFKDREGPIQSAAEDYYLKEMKRFHYDPRREVELEKLMDELFEASVIAPPSKPPESKAARKKTDTGR